MPTREEIEAELNETLEQKTRRVWQEIADDWKEHWQIIVETIEAVEKTHGFEVSPDMPILERTERAGFSERVCDLSEQLIDAVVMFTKIGDLPPHLQGIAAKCEEHITPPIINFHSSLRNDALRSSAMTVWPDRRKAAAPWLRRAQH